MPRWNILVEGTCRQFDTLFERFRAALLAHGGRATHEGTRVTMTIIIETQECHDAAKRALDLWWEYLPGTRFLTLLIWEVEDAQSTG